MQVTQDRPKTRALLGTYYTVPETADKLGWSEDTIRRHLVPIAEWQRGSGKVPFRRRGAMYLIPQWWLQSWLDDAVAPPSETGADE